jgi:hypothetical protein
VDGGVWNVVTDRGIRVRDSPEHGERVLGRQLASRGLLIAHGPRSRGALVPAYGALLDRDGHRRLSGGLSRSLLL